MKISNLLTLILLISSTYYLIAQSPGLLKAEGEIPKEFITPSTVKYKSQVQKLESNKTKRKEKKNKNQFLLETNFSIDDILQSGLVLFNDPATIYVNKVLNNLPFEDSKLEKKNPRAYVLNTSAVNAFATHQGIIFVTIGLLANLQNEAQLAFILSHELMHIKHQHSMNKFINSKDIDRYSRNEENVDKVAVDRSFFKKSMYSRQLEEEADEKGLEVFLKSEYDPKAILNTFMVLHYAYLPFEDIPFEKSFFEDEDFIFPNELWLDEVNKISPMEDFEEKDEKNASHPSSIKRLRKLESRVNNINSSNKKAFVLSEEEFHTIQKRSRYQIPFLNLSDENFPEAIYTSFLMLKEYPDDLELKKVIGKALYIEAKYKNYEEEEGGDWSYQLKKMARDAEGSVHQLYNFLSKINNKELTVLATKYNWNLYQEHPEDEEMGLIIKDIFIEFAGNFDSLYDFSQISKSKIDSSSTSADKNKSSSKYDNIEKSNKESEYWEYAFVKEMKNKDFEKHFEEGLAEFEKIKERNDYYDSREGRKEYNKRRNKEEKKGKQLGINKIVVVNPFYLSLDERKGGIIQYLRSEKKQNYFKKTLKELAKTSKINVEMLDVTDLSTDDIEKFNDIAEMNQYFGQQMDHYGLSLTPGYNQREVNEIAEKYNTHYFLWTGVISLHERNRGAWAAVAVSIIMPPLLPFSIANAVTPKYDMLYYAILYDVTTGRRSIIKMDFFNKRDSKTILNAHIYDVFHQIKSKRN